MIIPELTIKQGKEKALRNRHPWIYSGSVENVSEQIDEGQIVKIKRNDNTLVGFGFFEAGRQMICRVFEYTDQEIDVFSQDYWDNKLKKAWHLRQNFILRSYTNAYRLVNAEGDFLPGLIVDIYGEVAVIQFMTAGITRLSSVIVQSINNLGFKQIFYKSKEGIKNTELLSLKHGWLSENRDDTELEILENHIRFKINIETGLKTGFFLDQRDSRALVGYYAKDKKVLNNFSYSGGFSMYALNAGAQLVHSVDSSQKALDLCQENLEINDFDTNKHECICTDVFDYLKNMREDYDLIILDPPAFAKSSKAVSNAARGYKEINLLALKNIKSGGMLFTFSCSQKIDKDLFRKIVFGAAADAHRNVKVVHQITQPADHPINIYNPETEYLKGLVLYVE